ncbi:MAG: SO_0444 family Cu/Zn efflux transporter [Kiritimatiellia bacterium]|jgi:uncharacterized membrane protein YraQ (UPF0718 family)|nr:SO_0444 family Cu/Zn efflux transporter [Kiritimatiellia bacterium]
MIAKVANVIGAVWLTAQMMAPYLLLGFAVAGVLSVVITPAWVRRHLGRRGTWQVVKAALLGVPLPLCSCGVLPLAFSLRREGAGKGATVSFLASTPQTGVDSILLTWSLLGPVFAAARVAAAFVSGVAAGWLTDWTCSDRAPAATGPEAAGGCCGACAAGPLPGGDAALAPAPPAWWRALRHGLVTLPRELARPLLLGVVVSGVVTAFVPDGFFAGHLPPGISSYLLAMVIGLPLYVCSASSVPLAASFLHMGVSPGAAMVFLIAGPATNAASVLALWRQIGRAGTAAYLAAIAAVAILAGGLLDLSRDAVRESLPAVRRAECAHAGHHGAEGGAGWLGAVPAVLLLAMLLPGLLPKGRSAEAGPAG